MPPPRRGCPFALLPLDLIVPTPAAGRQQDPAATRRTWPSCNQIWLGESQIQSVTAGSGCGNDRQLQGGRVNTAGELGLGDHWWGKGRHDWGAGRGRPSTGPGSTRQGSGAGATPHGQGAGRCRHGEGDGVGQPLCRIRPDKATRDRHGHRVTVFF